MRNARDPHSLLSTTTLSRPRAPRPSRLGRALFLASTALSGYAWAIDGDGLPDAVKVPPAAAPAAPSQNAPGGQAAPSNVRPDAPAIAIPPRTNEAAGSSTPSGTPSSPAAPNAAPASPASPASPAEPGLPTAAPAAAKDPAPAPLPGTGPLLGFGRDTIDGVLVTVAEDVILLSDLQRALRASSDGQTTLLPTGELRGGALGPRDAEIILESLVNQKVLGQRVKEMGIDVGPDELESEINAFLKQQDVTREEFERELAKEGETVDSHREEFRNQLETQRFIGRVIRPLVTVTEDEVKNFYMQQVGAAANPTQKVKLRSLMINVPADLQESQRQAKQERVANIRKEVDSGATFASMVKLYSESPDALKTEGLLPARPVRDLPAELQTRLKEIKPGQVVGPLQLGSSVFYFEFLGFEIDNAGEFQAQKAQWENRLLELKFKERLDDYVRAERTKIKIVRRPMDFAR